MEMMCEMDHSHLFPISRATPSDAKMLDVIHSTQLWAGWRQTSAGAELGLGIRLETRDCAQLHTVRAVPTQRAHFGADRDVRCRSAWLSSRGDLRVGDIA
eukprot:scaffold1896_cov121-Isochrysis_galbana.AAC.9